MPAPDGTLWVALFGTNKLARLDPSSGEPTEIALPDPLARPRRLVVDDSGTVWYTAYARGFLGAYVPKTGRFTEWPTPTPRGAPYGIAIGPDGRIWFEEATSGDMVAFDPRDGSMERIGIPTRGAIVRHMVVDQARGRIWLALSGTGRIGRIDVPPRRAPTPG